MAITLLTNNVDSTSLKTAMTAKGNYPDIMSNDWALANYEVIGYTESKQGAIWTISFSVNGLPYTGASNNDATALAIGVLALLAV